MATIRLSDASIKKVVPNDLSKIVKESQIKAIILNGKTATNLYRKLIKGLEIETISLPSTSPANATYGLDKLVEEYQIIKKFTE